MAKSKQLVRFTFWINNLMLFLLLLVVLSLTAGLIPTTIGKISIIFIFIFSIFSKWYKWKHFSIKNTFGLYDYDEREQSIALKINSLLLYFLFFELFLLLILIFPLMSGTNNVYTLGLIIIFIILGSVFLVNLLYFYLWNRYDSE